MLKSIEQKNSVMVMIGISIAEKNNKILIKRMQNDETISISKSLITIQYS